MTKKKVIRNRFAEIFEARVRESNHRDTRRQIAAKTGVNRVTVDRYYNNDVERFDAEVVAKLCTYLDVSVSDFFIEVYLEEDEDPQFKTLLLECA